MGLSWREVMWESEFFGIRTARIEAGHPESKSLRSVLDELDAHEIVAAHWLISSDDLESIQQAERAGFRLVDIRLTLDWRPHRAGKLGHRQSAVIREADERDLDDLISLARSGFGQSRFYADGGYPETRCDDLFAQWVRRCWQEAPGLLYVAVGDQMARGFIAGSASEELAIGRIELLGVSPESRGAGVAASLISRIQERFAQKALETVEVVTQGRNVAAQRAYQARGFRTSRVELWYHNWRAPVAGRRSDS